MRNFQDYTLLNAKAATGIDKAVLVDGFKTCVMSFATDGGGTAALTVKFQGSIQDTCPDFSAAQSLINHWDNIEVVDYQDGAAIDGDTGVSVATADDYRIFEANVNGIKWLCARVTARTAGSVTVKAKLFGEA
jgi:hypothetical protein